MGIKLNGLVINDATDGVKINGVNCGGLKINDVVVWRKPSAGTPVAKTMISKTTTSNSWDAGCYSIQSIPPNTDGEVFCKFVTSDSLLGLKMIGLSSAPAGETYNSMEHALYLINAPTMQVYESGANKGNQFTGMVLGDEVSIFRDGTTGDVYYRKNGVTQYTYLGTKDPSLEMFVNVSIRSPNASGGFIEDIYLKVNGVDTGLVWESFDDVAVTPPQYDLHKNSGGNIYNAFASSVEVIPANTAGAFHHVISTAAMTYFFGFSTLDSLTDYDEMEYGGFQLAGGTLRLYRDGGNYSGNIVSGVTAGDKVSLHRAADGTVDIRLNGVSQYTDPVLNTAEFHFGVCVNTYNKYVEGMYMEVDGVYKPITWQNLTNMVLV